MKEHQEIHEKEEKQLIKIYGEQCREYVERFVGDSFRD